MNTYNSTVNANGSGSASDRPSGTIAIIGRPNVGKSTLMNYILNKKISITSRKPQTTRHRILGIKTTEKSQMVFVDTPGLHLHHSHTMNRMMNKAAKNVVREVDVIVWMIEAMRWTADDDFVMKQLQSVEVPVILVINKIDEIKNKLELLPFMENLATQFPFKKIIPLSAKTGLQVTDLENTLIELLPHQGKLFSSEQITDRSDRFIVSEFVREKLMRLLGDEIPYELTVTIDIFEESKNIIKIAAVIWVAKEGQKGIVIGANGAMLKKVGTQARKDLESYFEKKILLKLWVKVKENWSDDARALKEFGLE